METLFNFSWLCQNILIVYLYMFLKVKATMCFDISPKLLTTHQFKLKTFGSKIQKRFTTKTTSKI